MQLQLMAMTCVVLMVQAMARVHRLGQSKTVHVYRLVSGGTAEERVVQRAQKKLYLSETVNRGVTNGGETTKLSGVELLSMIQFGAAAVFAVSRNNFEFTIPRRLKHSAPSPCDFILKRSTHLGPRFLPLEFFCIF